MSRFYASIQGSRGEATRQGHSHITAHPRGWSAGVRVEGYTLGEAGDRDAFDVRVSRGSNGHGTEVPAFQLVELGAGWLRISCSDVFGGSVFYLSPAGERFSRIPDDAPESVREAFATL